MQTNKVLGDPLVSVVMCTYNGGLFIQEQLDSILHQTYPSIEIIIVDDRSTDDTYKILEQYAALSKNVHLFRNESNVGYIRNFSNACSYAKGDYIAISDQDDVWHPDKIKRMLEQWKPGVPLMYCNSVRFENDVPWDASANPIYRRFEGKNSRKIAIFNTISGHAMMVKKNFLSIILPFPENLSYDWWSGVVAACNGGVGYVPDILVFQRVHGKNITVGGMYDHNGKKNRVKFKRMVLNHLEKFSDIPVMPEKDTLFFRKLLRLWKEAVTKKFSWPLFFFLINNRHIIFNYKKRKVGILSHIKHSYRLAKN